MASALLARNQLWSLCLRSPGCRTGQPDYCASLHQHGCFTGWPERCAEQILLCSHVFDLADYLGSPQLGPALSVSLLAYSCPCSASGFYLYHIPKGLCFYSPGSGAKTLSLFQHAWSSPTLAGQNPDDVILTKCSLCCHHTTYCNLFGHQKQTKKTEKNPERL